MGQLTDDNVDNKLRWGGVRGADQQNGCVDSFLKLMLIRFKLPEPVFQKASMFDQSWFLEI